MRLLDGLFGKKEIIKGEAERENEPVIEKCFGITLGEILFTDAIKTFNSALRHLGISHGAEALFSEALEIRSKAESESDFTRQIRSTVCVKLDLGLGVCDSVSRLLLSFFLPFSTFTDHDPGNQRKSEDEEYLTSCLARAFSSAGIAHVVDHKNSWITGGYGRAGFSAGCSVYDRPGKPTMAVIKVGFDLGRIRQLDHDARMSIVRRLCDLRFEAIAFDINSGNLGAGFSVCIPFAEAKSAIGVWRVAATLRRGLQLADSEVDWFASKQFLLDFHNITYPRNFAGASGVSFETREMETEFTEFGEQSQGGARKIEGIQEGGIIYLGDLRCQLEYSSGKGIFTIPLEWPVEESIYALCFDLNLFYWAGYSPYWKISCGFWTVGASKKVNYAGPRKNLVFVFDLYNLNTSDDQILELLMAELNGYIGGIARRFNTDSCREMSSELRAHERDRALWDKFVDVRINPQRRGSETSDERALRLRAEEKEEVRAKLVGKAQSALAGGRYLEADRLAVAAAQISAGKDVLRLRAYVKLLSEKSEEALKIFNMVGPQNNVSDLVAMAVAHSQLGGADLSNSFAVRAADVAR